MDEMPTAKLTFQDFQTLANLLRRFEVHHTDRNSAESATAAATWQAVRVEYGRRYVPGE